MIKRFWNWFTGKEEDELKFNYVQQEDPKGCMIAVAAMVTGTTYQEARKAIGYSEEGTSMTDVLPYCLKHNVYVGGLVISKGHGGIGPDGNLVDRVYIDIKELFDSPLVVITEEPDEEGDERFHAMLWTGEQFYDPDNPDSDHLDVAFMHFSHIYVVHDLGKD